MLLLWFIAVDPAPGVTTSSSPFGDEGRNVLNARNEAVLGRWSTDDFSLHLLSLPFSIIEAAVFGIAGAGIVQARILPVGATFAAVLLLAAGLRRDLGAGPAGLGAIAFGSSPLVLYYGRLAYLEPVVACGLVAAGMLATRIEGRRWAISSAAAGAAVAIAVGTKLNGAGAAIGAIGGLLVADPRDWHVRRWVAVAVAVTALLGAAWLLLVALPQRSAITLDLATVNPGPLPRSPGELLARMTRYISASDGAVTLAAPLWIAGAVGLIAAARRWRELPPGTRRLTIMALGWWLVGIGILLVVPYRPNRWVVPVLPPLAILSAVGASIVLRRIRESRPRWAPVALGLAIIAMAGPGLVLFTGWMRTAPTSLLALQSRFEATLPPGAVVEGSLAPTFAMGARVVTIVPVARAQVNAGDLYGEAGVRWVVDAPDKDPPPGWAADHPDVWAARQEIFCFTWGGDNFCLWHLP
jgi:4-amino-4-deoxy-L-arabinose transferase-like glycosyltransferase